MVHHRSRPLLRRLFNYFIKGILIIFPLALTFFIILRVLQFTDNLLPVSIPGLGFILVIVIITCVGYFGQGLLSKPVFDLLDDLLSKTPGLSRIYNIAKDLIESMVGDKRTFKEPVVVDLHGNGILKLGFITRTDLSQIGIENYVSVYFPHAYAISGDLFLVPSEQIKPLPQNPNILPFIMSGGVADLQDDTNFKRKPGL